MKCMRECCGLKPLHEASLLGDPVEEEVAPEVVSLNLGDVKSEVERIKAAKLAKKLKKEKKRASMVATK